MTVTGRGTELEISIDIVKAMCVSITLRKQGPHEKFEDQCSEDFLA